jgi:hypothetical protein
MNIETILAECVAAHDAAALAQWVKDGERDCGSCGGYMLGYRANTKFAKAILAAGLGYKSEQVFVNPRLPAPIRTQHDMVEESAKRAFKNKALEYGIAPSKAWSYAD